MLQGLRMVRGILRSLGIYYGHRGRASAKHQLYRRFVQPGDLVFDIGAHVGDRIKTFRRLRAKVVAVEPQPALVTTLKMLYGRKRNVVIEAKAVGRQAGTTAMKINVDNPTVSTVSEAFIDAARGVAGWEEQIWEKSVDVPVTTLDALIAEHGRPSFIKIDVEGFEEEALAGLSQPVNALSFEFTTIQREMAHACVERCVTLGFSQFNGALGESQELGAWRTAAEIVRWLDELPDEANSGDVYARL